MDKNSITLYQKMFDSKVKILKNQSESLEYWTARDLQALLGYQQWRNFADVIAKAIMSCQQVHGVDGVSYYFENLPPAEDVKKIQRRSEKELKNLPQGTLKKDGDHVK